MPYKILANNTYDDSLRYTKKLQGFGGTMAYEPTSTMSLDRFARAAKLVKNFPEQGKTPVIDYAFGILKNVSNERTKWSIVYDMKNLKIHFKTYSHNKIRLVEFKKFDLSCQGPAKVINLDAKLSGNISDQFIDYTRKMNKELILNAFSKTFLSNRKSDGYLYRRILYPETLTCSQ
ncbi:MAG: linear amide C-N hydrolase [Desulfobacterales bacterium]|nr:linear amide C-N hydrolase [Desulfobacterales bacterium]